MAGVCRRAGVVRLDLLGSILTERFHADSEIDLLVETDAGQPFGLPMDRSEILGRCVHLTLLGGVPASERPGVPARARMLDAA